MYFTRKYINKAILRYGNTIRYIIPEFTPSAISASPFSITALHITHCEYDI